MEVVLYYLHQYIMLSHLENKVIHKRGYTYCLRLRNPVHCF